MRVRRGMLAVAALGAVARLGRGEAVTEELPGGDTAEILKVTVGERTLLSPLTYQNCASLSVSRTGVVAVFYPKPRTGPRFYRTSHDGGASWGPELASPPVLAGGASSVALRDGGVLKFLTTDSSFKGEAQFHTSPMEGEYRDGWFTLHSTFAWFNDDFTSYEVAPVQVYMPDAVTSKQVHLGVSSWPIFDKGKILQLDNGDLLAPMYGLFKGDTKSRVILSRSTDRGRTWRYYATVAVAPADPNPELPGQYNGPCEPSIDLLANGQMICVMRTQYSHYPAEYRPMAVSWSDDLGRTWTRPRPTKPHLMTIWPTVQTLDNGVVACIYGRPGFHMAFSLDNGRTWQDRVSFSHQPEPRITGQVDGIKVGPNRLLAIGGVEEGTAVFPVTVERVRVSSAFGVLTGRIADADGVPIAGATVERSPNRYASEDWLEDTELDVWKAGPKIVDCPLLTFRSIQGDGDFPTAPTDAGGLYRFDNVALGEYVLTVAAPGYAPRHRRVKVGPNGEPADFVLRPGKLVCGRVLDSQGAPVSGACVVLNRWHCHSDLRGYFHWSVAAPLPEQVTYRVCKRYSFRYGTLTGSDSIARIEEHPFVLKPPP